MSGKVVRRRLRLPKVSIVYTAGKAKSQLMRPKPKEARSAWMLSKPDWEKMVEE